MGWAVYYVTNCIFFFLLLMSLCGDLNAISANKFLLYFTYQMAKKYNSRTMYMAQGF